MQETQQRKNAAGAIIHNDINNHPHLNIPMIINEQDGQIYEVFSVGFHSNDGIAMVTTDGFSTTRVHTPIVTVKNYDGSFQAYRLPLELEYWVFSCLQAASAGKNPFPCKVAFGIIENKFYVEFK
ncbi:hypothetical protein [Bacillus thuringiensis]|uniref:hypothetical protein n=1 Tax=Bacillus thuringiensis TaxID=1428 RepID=UPI000BFCCCA0|nr:hypothetical protein [Bacillus thuringiensis]PGM06385.1 hypothetical protein CN938_23415 [Bacillus thuringiensis]